MAGAEDGAPEVYPDEEKETKAMKAMKTSQPKAKAKAKQSPNAKAKPSPKAKTVAKKGPSSVLKKPAAAVAPTKRPAASSSVNDAIKQMRKGLEESEADASQSEDGAGRDKGKAVKYAKMRKDLPEHIRHLVEEESNRKANPRAFKTNLINKLYKREANGTLSLRLDQPIFQEHQSVFNKRYKKDEEKALPESVMHLGSKLIAHVKQFQVQFYKGCPMGCWYGPL